MSTQPTNPENRISYIQCDKGGFHYGQALNMVCLEPQCAQQLVCCCACIEESHKKHNTRPLKMIVKQAQQQISKMKPTKFNIDVIIDITQCNQKNTLQNFHLLRKQLEQQLNKIEKLLQNYYNSVISQIRLKNSDPNAQFHSAYQTLQGTKIVVSFKEAVKKMATMIPSRDEEVADLTEPELIDAITSSNEQVGVVVRNTIEELNKKLTTYNQTLAKQMNFKNIWSRTFYKFSSTFKHPDIKVISDDIVKSSNTSGYKFAIMEPNLQKGTKTKTFSFKIKECTSNWVAIGMCHQKIVASKAYAFNFSSLGHGGYLISANGGSWSNTKLEANNAVKAFKFGKNDVITCVVNFETNKMVFKKKGTNDSYQLIFDKIVGDELYPCALFYYINDEVEFVSKLKD